MNPLEVLELPPFLDGETPPVNDGRRWESGSGMYFTPDGEPIPGNNMTLSWTRIANAKARPENFRRTEFVVEGSAECAVSTVYMGLNHQYFTGGPILIWETMIFGGPFNNYQWRYSTRAAAMHGHQKVVDTLAAMLGNPPQAEVELPGLVLPQDDR